MKINTGLKIFALVMVAFSLTGIVSVFIFFALMADNARVVNYSGLVRGATQRLVKLEIAGQQSGKLITQLDRIVNGLINGDKELKLPRAQDQEFLAKMREVERAWGGLKETIQRARQDKAHTDSLLKESEEYFELTNKAVSIAEGFAEREALTLKAMQTTLLIFTFIVLIGIILLSQKRIARPLSDLVERVTKVADGDLRISIDHSSKGKTGVHEVGMLSKGLNFLTQKIRGAIRNLHSTSSDVIMAIKQINITLRKVTDATNSQFRFTENVVSAMKKADTAQKETFDSANSLSNFSSENLSSLLEIRSTSERIAENTNQLFQSLIDTHTTVLEMSATAKEIAYSAEELSSSTEETSAAVEEISATVKEVENSAKGSARHASQVTKVVSEVGMMSVIDAVEGMEKISESIEKSSELMERLGARSKDIEKILSVIKNVTEQTNLLSLNAAILAAQAGEYGKGFSVVADEIGALADRTASSTKEISNIIRTVQAEMAEAINVAQNSKQIAHEGNALVMKIGDAFRETLHISEKSSEMASTIERATAEQSRGIIQIKEAIGTMRMMVEHVAKSTHEQELGSKRILDVIENVKNMSELVNKGMQEQAAGIHLMSKNLELANDKIKQIADSSSEQKKTNEGILIAIEEIKAAGDSTVSVINEMSTSFRMLYQEAEALKKGIEGFKFE